MTFAAQIMPRKLFRKYLPHADRMRTHRLVAMFGRFLQEPNLWHLNRKSVAGAVAIGLFAGLIPGPLQMLAALLLAIALRRNIPVAVLVTFYTNPFTIVPLYLLAYAYGALLLGEPIGAPRVRHFEMDWAAPGASLHAMLEWMFALGKPLAIGLLALGLSLAALGYVAVLLGWRAYVVLAWRARAKRRSRR
jgi:uncharacterized protein (DUF2062 family)